MLINKGNKQEGVGPLLGTDGDDDSRQREAGPLCSVLPKGNDLQAGEGKAILRGNWFQR